MLKKRTKRLSWIITTLQHKGVVFEKHIGTYNGGYGRFQYVINRKIGYVLCLLNENDFAPRHITTDTLNRCKKIAERHLNKKCRKTVKFHKH